MTKVPLAWNMFYEERITFGSVFLAQTDFVKGLFILAGGEVLKQWQMIFTCFLVFGGGYFLLPFKIHEKYFDGLVQDCSNSIANALELLQSCTEP